jgi:hypothetical protein
MLASQPAVADDGILIHPEQATGFAHPTTFVDVGQERNNVLLRQPSAEKRRAFSFGKTALAGPTVQQAALLVGSVVVTHAQVAGAPFAVVGTLRVLATEPSQVVHGLPSVAREFITERPRFYKITDLTCNTNETPGKIFEGDQRVRALYQAICQGA